MYTIKLGDTIIAESKTVETVEGNFYFPPESVKMEYLSKTDSHTTCPWKGLASYYTVSVGDESSVDSAWYYPEPKDAAKQIKNHIAFYKNKFTISE